MNQDLNELLREIEKRSHSTTIDKAAYDIGLEIGVLKEDKRRRDTTRGYLLKTLIGLIGGIAGWFLNELLNGT